MKVPGQAPGVSSGGRGTGRAREPLRYNPMTRAGASMGNPVGAIYEGRAWAGVGRAVTQAAHAMDKLHRVRREQRNAIETNDAFMQKTANYIEWRKSMASKEFIPLDEVPPEIMESLNIRTVDFVVDKEGNMVEEPRTAIPKHEVFAEMEQKFLGSQTTASSQLISDVDFRSDWVGSEEQFNQKVYAKSSIESIELGVKFDTAKEKNMYEVALNAGNITLAKHIAATMQYHSPEEINAFTVLANKTGEENRYKELLTIDDHASKAEALNILKLAADQVDPANDEYRSSMGGGYLNMDERLTFHSAFKKKMASLSKAMEADFNVAIDIAKEDARSIVSGIPKGYKFSMDTKMETLHVLESFPPKKRDHLLEKKLRVAISFEPEITKAAQLPRGSRAAMAQGYTDATATSEDPTAAKYLADTMNTAVAAMDTQFDKNSMEYLNKWTDSKVAGVNFSAPPSAEMVQALERRVLDANLIEQQFQEGTNSIFLESEIKQISNTLENGTLGQKLGLLDAMQSGLGTEYMRTAMDQLNANKVGVVYTTTGELMADNKSNAARYNMMGYDVRKNFPEITKDTVGFAETFDDVTLGVYANNPGRQNEIMESALNIYSFMRSLEGNTTDDFDDGIFEQAIGMAMGDRSVINYGNSNIIPTDDTINEDAFRTYMDTLQPATITAMAADGNGLDKISATEVLGRIRNDNLTLINADNGSLMLYDIRKNAAVKTKNGQIFLIPMNPAVINSVQVAQRKPVKPRVSGNVPFLPGQQVPVTKQKKPIPSGNVMFAPEGFGGATK